MRQHALAVFFLLVTLTLLANASNIVKREPGRRYYTLHVPQAQDDSADAARHVATTLGARFEGNVGELKTYFMMSVPENEILQKRDDEDPILISFQRHKDERQRIAKRDNDPFEMVHRIDRQVPRKRFKRGVMMPPPRHLVEREPPFAEINQGMVALARAQQTLGIQDPGFPRQWHLVNQDIVGNDINVTGVWEQGIKGNGTIVAILDDGLDYESRDLADNFYAPGSYDFNDHTELPKPRLFDDTHGTRCAGQIAAIRNDACGVGIAYEAKVAGVRILSGEITDADEAMALNYKFQENDIYSCSWGPPDNGETMEAPEGILADAFINGVENGRGGKGSIYVFATGNGAVSGDNCNFDGYTNSIYTITVGAIDHDNNHPPYSESCSAQMVVTYSSGGGHYIYTTNVGENQCSDRHGGTSAAAPSAAGVFALVLSVRPELTWRDLQHLCVQTAVPINLDDDDWKRLPSGRLYNHKFGYGKLDAYALVEAAKTFELVNKQTFLELPVAMKKTAIPDSSEGKKRPLTSIVTVTPEMVKNAGLRRLEHVTVTVNLEHQRRGDIVITLQSPNMVESELATLRPADRSADGIRNWKFMSVKHWDEDPVGNWTLFIYDMSHPEATGSLLNWTLTLYGESDPSFTGEPIQRPLANHNTTVSEIEHHLSTATPTASTSVDTHVPARPTRVKVKPSTTSSVDSGSHTSGPSYGATNGSSVSPAGETTVAAESEANQKSSSGGSVIAYAVVGSGAILALVTGMYLQKRKRWRAPALESPDQTRRSSGPVGYEFTTLRQSEEDEDDETPDDRPLLPDNGNSSQQTNQA